MSRANDEHDGALRFGQFSLRFILWLTAAVSWLLLDYRNGHGLGVPGLLMILGLAPAISNVCRRTPSFEASVQLLIGAGVFVAVCGGLLTATWRGWLNPRSGVHEYVSFALVVFCVVFGARVRWMDEQRRGSWLSLGGYFAFLLGAFMLNFAAMTLLIRRFY